MDSENGGETRDVSTVWAMSHVAIAILVLGVTLVQSVRIALYVSVLVFVALSFEYVFGPVRVVLVSRDR